MFFSPGHQALSLVFSHFLLCPSVTGFWTVLDLYPVSIMYREGNGNPFQYTCLKNPMDRGACWATVHAAAEELDTTKVTLYTCTDP